MSDLTNKYLEQVEEVLNTYVNAYKALREKPGSNAARLITHKFITRCRALIPRVTGPNSPYTAQLSNLKEGAPAIIVPKVMGVVTALQADLKAGYFETASELLHSEVFGDFLEMGDHLLENGYKDAAAVVAGSTLEAHLRQLCQKFGVEIEALDGRGTLRPKKADRMNSDLASASAYSKLDQKNVIAWLDLRNKAAHGKYDEYDLKQVALLTQSVRDFISRNPA